MKTGVRLGVAAALSGAVLVASVGIGSVAVPPGELLRILFARLGGGMPAGIEENLVRIVWDIRLPRTLAAFLVGAALSVSGAVMQSVLRNPLASSFTLGVSSGASLAAAAVMVSGASFFGMFTLPAAGFAGGLSTVLLAMGFAMRLDRNMENQTVILVGMVLSLFVNAILTLINAMSREVLQQLIFWQMGSLSSRGWAHVGVLLPVTAAGVLLLEGFCPELDLMTFGEAQAQAVGVDTRRAKLLLISLAALLTGTAVSFSGVIGFVDLIAPHVVRRLFGPSHRVALPACALLGGAFLTLADTISRTVLSPSELPVGAVTALIGAPFFAYLYFRRGKGRGAC